ncbi:MAG: 50S ribosomal protein L23 [Gemmatimonadales bacterium]
MYQTVVQPVVTEKSSEAYARRREYIFRVRSDANKREIRKAIEELFGVTVVGVRTLHQPSKRRTRGRSVGRVPRWKKAYVRLREGEEIEGLYEG